MIYRVNHSSKPVREMEWIDTVFFEVPSIAMARSRVKRLTEQGYSAGLTVMFNDFTVLYHENWSTVSQSWIASYPPQKSEVQP